MPMRLWETVSDWLFMFSIQRPVSTQETRGNGFLKNEFLESIKRGCPKKGFLKISGHH